MLIQAGCDVNYLKEHGRAFVESFASHDNDVRLIISNDVRNPIKHFPMIDDIQKRWEHYDHLYTLYDIDNIQHIYKHLNVYDQFKADRKSPEDWRIYYSCLRFLDIPMNQPVLITDIDAYQRKPFTIPDDVDLGLYFRLNNNVGANDWERLGMKIAAGLVYINPASEAARAFVKALQLFMTSTLPLRWFIDQRAIYEAWKQTKITHPDMKVLDFASDHRYLDWEFRDDSYIWTGKGARKYTSQKYIEGKKQYE